MPTFRLLDINLTTGTSSIRDITPLFDEYLGGTGVAQKLLMDEPIDYAPYAPEAPIYFAIGPFSSVFPVATKTVALFKSPLNGNLGESHAGGRLALAMYGAGFHVLRITGKAPHLCYLTIDGDKIALKRANSLKGMSALATERVLRDRENASYKRSIVRIGPAGERLSPIAEATVDSSRHFGRLGLGGVMGSKNLKAFMIWGGASWPISDRGAYNAFYKKLYDTIVNSPVMRKYHDLGTPVNVIPLSKIHGLPTRNFSQGFFEGARDISGEHFADKHLAQQIACAHCQVGCIHMASLRENFSKDEHMFKTFKVSYDHELIYALGSNLSIQCSEEILKLLLIVEKQGWDAISMGVTLAWATDAFQRGYINKTHTDGLVLNFGDGAGYLKALHLIAAGKTELFRDLEKGCAFCAEKYGGADFAITFGRNEAAGYATGLHAFLGYATGVRHSHLDAAGYSVDQNNLVKPAPDHELTKKMYDEAVWRMIPNSLVLCLFARNVYTKEIILEGLNVLGITSWTEQRLLDFARKMHALKNRYKLNCGFSFDTLELPERLTKISTSNGLLTKERFREQIGVFKTLLDADFQDFGV
jgi:aldehyde:ferredoxin oxidoreductase